MTDAKATFAIVLEDETSGAAQAAANSLADLKARIDEDTRALSQMRRAMRQMKQAGLSGSDAFKELSSQADALKVSLGKSQSAFVKLGGTFGAGSKSPVAGAANLTKATASLGSEISAVGGPMTKMSGSMSRLGSLFASGTAATVALAAGFIALGAAVVTATGALLRFAVAQSDARRSEALQIEGLNTLRTQWGRTTASVAEFQQAIDRASDSTNLGRGTLQEYARSLSRAGLRGEVLTEAVEAMGIAAVVQGDRGANRFRALAFQAARSGRSVRDLAEDYRARLGPIAAKQMLSIRNQTDRLKGSLDRIFSGLRTEPFLEALDQVLSLFSQSSATGRALKTIIEALFQPLIDQADVVGPVIKRLFQGFVIGALIATIWILRLKKAFGEIFGDADRFDEIFVIKVGIGLFAAFAVVVGVVALALAAAAASLLVFVGGLLIVPALLGAAAFAVGVALGAIVDFFEETDFKKLAGNLVDGLVEGLRRRAGKVLAAVKGLASDIMGTFKSALGIASPSSVFEGFGLNVAQGAEQGIEAGTPGVEDATASLVEVPNGGGLASGSASLSFGDIHINAAETSDPRELAMQFRDELASVLEGVGVELGVPA